MKKQNSITLRDSAGREFQVPKEEYRRKVLPGMIRDAWSDPNELSGVISMSLEDGFVDAILAATERLINIDPEPERSHVIRCIALMKSQDMEAAELVIRSFIDIHGATGTALTNLAKVKSEQGDALRAREILWQALQLDPNQENGLQWWSAIHYEEGGDEARLSSLHKVAQVAGSWFPQLWIARDELEKGHLSQALNLYRQCLTIASERPEALMIITGDLGNNGRHREMIGLIYPLYSAERHGPWAGLNLLQASINVREYGLARSLLESLRQLERPDIQKHLDHFEQMIPSST